MRPSGKWVRSRCLSRWKMSWFTIGSHHLFHILIDVVFRSKLNFITPASLGTLESLTREKRQHWPMKLLVKSSNRITRRRPIRARKRSRLRRMRSMRRERRLLMVSMRKILESMRNDKYLYTSSIDWRILHSSLVL